ncbi:hypothetical protein GKZ89_19375 [Bacillus mangrovi]|uniref:Uncharacterized protein n=1 Tax=Metabacillus mangrovi TaxID=1491830 RepID=A0A7X2V6X8_9BACI|nr:hypothetical protein [Metabacillus mangrovi]MTH55559.1 hypothetical protein [Metabacillus mangrovi]
MERLRQRLEAGEKALTAFEKLAGLENPRKQGDSSAAAEAQEPSPYLKLIDIYPLP